MNVRNSRDAAATYFFACPNFLGSAANLFATKNFLGSAANLFATNNFPL